LDFYPKSDKAQLYLGKREKVLVDAGYMDAQQYP